MLGELAKVTIQLPTNLELKRKAQHAFQANPSGSWAQWVSAAYFNRVNLNAVGFYDSSPIALDLKTGKGMPFEYHVFGAGCVEVTLSSLSSHHDEIDRVCNAINSPRMSTNERHSGTNIC